MFKLDSVPKSPNTANCFSLGIYTGKFYLAYGSGKRVCIFQANTLIIHQLTEEFLSKVYSVVWARTGGRLAIGLDSEIQVLGPKDFVWHSLLKIATKGPVFDLSWSYFSDCILSLSEKASVWNIDPSLEVSELWCKESLYSSGNFSPDGRLIALVQHSRLYIYHKDTDFNIDPLIHQSNIIWISWKDINTLKLYINSYNPNSLIVASEDGWIKVWSEYYSPTGLGFNIVFQMKTSNCIAGWIRNMTNMENHISLLSIKQDQLKKQKVDIQFSLNSKSCIARPEKTQPDNLLYGAVIKERTPVEWLVIWENNKVMFYCCEGLGSYPVTAINIRLHLEVPMASNIWGISQAPLHAIKEMEEIQLIGVNKNKDFVRWRKKFEGKNLDEFELTSIRGGHDKCITEILCHKNLPLVCTIDAKGFARIWSCIRGIKTETGAVQNLVHWGILEGQTGAGKWLDTFALFLAVRPQEIVLFKWSTPDLKDLKMPSIKWEPVLTWKAKCSKIDVSKLQIASNTFSCYVLGLCENAVVVWKLTFDKDFSAVKVWEDQKKCTDCKLYSYMSNSVKCNTQLYTLANKVVTCYLLLENEPQVLWEKSVGNAQELIISSLVSVRYSEKLSFFSHEGLDQGHLENIGANWKIIFFTQESSECLSILNSKTLTIMARKPLKIVGESEMEWKHVTSFQLKGPGHLFSINSFHDFIVAHKKDLHVYSTEDSFKFSSLLNSVSDSKPFFHPLFLLELMRVQKENIVKDIIIRMNQCFDQINYTLNLELEDFCKSDVVAFDDQNSKELKIKINEKCMEIPGLDGDIMTISQLIGILDSISVIESQSRSLDDYAKVFFLNVKMFKYANEQKVPSTLKPMCLSTMEIAWALHSEQQDTLFQILFGNIPDWATLKMFGIGIWIRNQMKLKKMIEDIAMNDYRKNKEPKNIALWYMALGKKNILTELFKKDPDGAKIYNFMKNDFSQKDWQVKAQKNAFELRKQMKFELSAAFFILGGQVDSAVEVLAESLFDPQLALVIARLKEGEASETYQKVVTDYFLSNALQEKDPWLTSISYSLLGKHAESLQCIIALPSPPKFVPKAWNSNTSPSISGFHPSLWQFFSLLKNNIMVRRDSDNKGILLENFENVEVSMANRSAQAYLRGGLPVLALIQILKCPNNYNLIETAVKGYLMTIAKNCRHTNFSNEFSLLVTQVRYCSDKFNIPLRVLIDFVSDIFYKKDLRHFQCAFLVSCGLAEKGSEALLHQSSLIHIILSRFSRDPYFEFSNPSLAKISDELRSCMKLLLTPLNTFPESFKFQMMHIGISIYISGFLQSYISGAFVSAMSILQALDSFLNTGEFIDVVLDVNFRNNDKGIIGTWLRYLMTNKLLKILEKFKSKDIDNWLDYSLAKFNLVESLENTVESLLGPGRGQKKRPLMSIFKLKTRLKSMIRRILLIINSLISNENIKYLQKITEIFSVKGHVLVKELQPFFSSFEEYKEFDLYFEGNSQVYRLVQASAQSISTFIYEKPGKVSEALEKEGFIYQESIQENVNLFKNGLEVFKSKDPILGFAVNSTDKRHLVTISNGKKDKIREVNLEQCLVFKKVNQDLELDSEDPETYHECIKQFENVPSNSGQIFNPSISASLHHLYSPQTEEFEQEMKLPPSLWHRSPLKSLLASLSSFKSRQEKVEKIVAHPMLPLYVTGNELLTLWQFNRYESLQDFATSSSTPSKILSVKFNSFGDKLGACDQQGNFYLYKFDLQPTSFQPQLTLKNFTGLKASNFCFLNLGSVIATTGHKPKGFLSIYDTLLPPNRPPIHTENFGGKMICFLSKYQQLLMSDKKGKILRYDLRMRDVVETIETKHEHITDFKLGPSEITFITAGSEGIVKIWDARGSTVREVIDVARKGKSKSITQIECIDNTLFMSSQDGTVRLLRIIQQ